MSVVHAEVLDGVRDSAEVWSTIASAESNSSHPIAKALVAAAQDHGAIVHPMTDFVTVGGKGLSCTVQGRTVVIGTLDWCIESRVDTSQVWVLAFVGAVALV